MKRFAVVTVVVGLLLGGGGAYAAGRWVISNIGQIKPSVRAQLKGNQGPRGFTGAQGPQGPRGPAGANGANGTNGTNGATRVSVRNGNPSVVADSDTGTADVLCNPGEVATGGGFSKTGEGWALQESFPLSTGGTVPAGWHVEATNFTGDTQQLTATVVCASP
jgi:hypothetical protein